MTILCLAAISGLVWRTVPVREPSYQGKSLTEWLEEYNRARALDKTGPVDEAIRVMGTNTLPYLLAHLRRKDSPLKRMLFLFAEKHHLAFLPPPRRTPYLAPALLALKALGQTAKPVIPELLQMFEKTNTVREGGLALFSIGPESIPAFDKACEHTNLTVRIEAASFLAMLPASYNGDQAYYCIWYKFRASSKPQAYVARPPDSYFMVNLASLAGNDPSAGVRCASIAALARYYGTQYGDHPEIVIQALSKARGDADAHVRESATEALKTTGVGEPDNKERK
jgi:hypothetical protein